MPARFPFACGPAYPYTARVLWRGPPRGNGFNLTEDRIANMKHWMACLSFCAVLILTGCESVMTLTGFDTVNHTQLQVVAPKAEQKTRVTVPASDREAVKQALAEIGVKYHLEDRTKLSLVPETISSYAQPDVKYPIHFVAWAAKDRIVIDLFHKPPEVGETEAYRKMRDQIMEELEKHFGDRLVLVPKTNQIPGPAASH